MLVVSTYYLHVVCNCELTDPLTIPICDLMEFWGPTSLLYNGYQCCFLGVKWPQQGADHPCPFSPKVRNEQVYTSTVPLPARHVTWRPLHFQYKQTRPIHDTICQMLTLSNIRKEYVTEILTFSVTVQQMLPAEIIIYEYLSPHCMTICGEKKK